MDCTIVVVNYANEDVLPDCLQSIRATCDPATVETVVVDNSGGLARAGFPQRFPWARFLASPGNVGFARGPAGEWIEWLKPAAPPTPTPPTIRPP